MVELFTGDTKNSMLKKCENKNLLTKLCKRELDILVSSLRGSNLIANRKEEANKDNTNIFLKDIIPDRIDGKLLRK